MKKTILSVLLVSFFFAANAQRSEIKAAKNNYALYEVVVQSKGSMRKQLESLDLAKVNTDNAVGNSKTQADPELWAYRALIYSAISATDTVNKENAEDSFKVAQEAVSKAKELDTKKEYERIVESSEKNLAIMMQNRGVAAFNRKNFREAYRSFKFIADLMPKDSIFSLYTALAANGLNDYDEAIKYYRKSVDLNPHNPGLYQELERTYVAKKDTSGALRVITEGRKRHPNYLGLIFDELNIYLNRGEAAKQVTKIEEAISKDPENKTLLFVSGIAYSANFDNDRAAEAYKKALEIDPNYTDAIYNLAVLHINKGNEHVIQANKLPSNKSTEAKYKDLTKKFEQELNIALPLLEKARELNPRDLNTLNTLWEVYVKLNKMDKAAEVKKVLDQI